MALSIALTASPLSAAPSKQSSAATERAFTDGVIRKAKAGDLFDNISEEGQPTARHKASGLVCYFSGAPGESLKIYDGLPRGEDVSCNIALDGMLLTMFAMRPAMPIGLDQAFEMYVAEVRDAHPEAKLLPDRPFPVRQAEVTLPEWKTARFEVTLNNAPAYSRLAVAVLDGWVVEQRITVYPGTTQERADRVGESAMFLVLREMARARQARR